MKIILQTAADGLIYAQQLRVLLSIVGKCLTSSSQQPTNRLQWVFSLMDFEFFTFHIILECPMESR